MATLDSNLVALRHRHRGIYEGQEYDVAGQFKLTAGTVLAAGDILRAVPVGENQVISKVKAYAVGATGALAVSLGYFQILGPDGQPARVERRGPRGESEYTFVSPADDGDAFAPAAVLSTARQVIVTPATKLPGPVYMGALVTTGATLAGDVEVYIGATFDGEHGPRQFLDPYIDNTYLLGNG